MSDMASTQSDMVLIRPALLSMDLADTMNSRMVADLTLE